MVPVAFAITSIHTNYLSPSVGITTSVKCLSTPRTAFLDIGTAINLIKLETLKNVSVLCSDCIIALHPDHNIHGIFGSIVFPHCKVYLTLSFSPKQSNITASFYIASQVSLKAHFLIGFPTMHDNFINIFPSQNQISQKNIHIPALTSPSSSLSFASVVLSASRDNDMPY